MGKKTPKLSWAILIDPYPFPNSIFRDCHEINEVVSFILNKYKAHLLTKQLSLYSSPGNLSGIVQGNCCNIIAAQDINTYLDNVSVELGSFFVVVIVVFPPKA